MDLDVVNDKANFGRYSATERKQQKNQDETWDHDPPCFLSEVANAEHNLSEQRLLDVQLREQVRKLRNDERKQENDERCNDRHDDRRINGGLPDIGQHFIHPIKIILQ